MKLFLFFFFSSFFVIRTSIGGSSTLSLALPLAGGVDALPPAVPAPLPLLAILDSRMLVSLRKTPGSFGAFPLRLIFLASL